MYFGKVVVLGEKLLYSCKSGCIRAKEVVFGEIGCVRAKLVVFEQSGCIWTRWLVSGKVVVFG